MCTHHEVPHGEVHASASPNAGVSFLVEDMACAHCVGTIKTAIESSIPGTKVFADLHGKLVSVEGSNDFAKIRDIISLAGYTPASAPAPC